MNTLGVDFEAKTTSEKETHTDMPFSFSKPCRPLRLIIRTHFLSFTSSGSEQGYKDCHAISSGCQDCACAKREEHARKQYLLAWLHVTLRRRQRRSDCQATIQKLYGRIRIHINTFQKAQAVVCIHTSPRLAPSPVVAVRAQSGRNAPHLYKGRPAMFPPSHSF